MTRFAIALLTVAGCGSAGSPGSLHMSISDNAGSNVELLPVDFPVATGGKDTARGIFDFDAQLARPPGGNRLVILNVHETPGLALAAGRTFVVERPPLDTDWMPGHAIVTLTDSTPDGRSAIWQADGGSVTVVVADGDRVGLHFDAMMQSIDLYESRGSFRLTGDCSVEKVAETHFISAGP